MKVLFAAAEMSPLAKVGGLGDVAGSLPRALRGHGLDVRVAMPFFASVDRAKASPRRIIDRVRVPWHDGPQLASIWLADVRGVPVFLVENDRFFGRPNVYAYEDDSDRFLFFCDALIAAAPRLPFTPHVVHAHDWHAALLLTRLAAAGAHAWSAAGRVYTIHNLGLQGPFGRTWAEPRGIPAAQLVAPDGLPPETALSAMAQGIMHADRVNTVSHTYAKEILTPEYGAGLDALLRQRAAVVNGIVNGIDYEEFDPATDPALATHFDAGTLARRAENKRALQREAALPENADAPVFAAVTRLFAQKGIDLVAAAFEPLLSARNAQLIVLGTGEEAVHGMLRDLEARHPGKMKLWLDFNPPLGQRIYGGCDIFLMPSRYEPCGLGQLISLRYGAAPLVRRTGGLADTVTDVDAAPDSGTGFVFEDATADALRAACERAITAFADRPRWRALQDRGMRQDWSWRRAAGAYIDLYQTASRARGAGAERSA